MSPRETFNFAPPPWNSNRNHIRDSRPEFRVFLIFLANQAVDLIPDHLPGLGIQFHLVDRGIVDLLAAGNGDVPGDHAHAPENVAPDKVRSLGIVHVFRQDVGAQIRERGRNADVLLVAELFCVNTLRFHFFLAPGGLVRFVAHFQPSLKSLFLIQLPTIIYMAKRCFTIKIRNSSRQNAEKYCPEVEKTLWK
ncbi:hypothetical protein [Victivallis vadensis]|uniref:hypothetical protein n=1 Tax=Victivallis vadensis TaxID=172901 RepID=UPI003D0756F9